MTVQQAVSNQDIQPYEFTNYILIARWISHYSEESKMCTVLWQKWCQSIKICEVSMELQHNSVT